MLRRIIYFLLVTVLLGGFGGLIAFYAFNFKPKFLQTVIMSAPKPTETVMVYGAVFGSIGWVALGAGVLLVLVSPLIARRMHGVH